MQATKPSRKKMNRRTQPLDVFFTPRSVAVVGATENQNISRKMEQSTRHMSESLESLSRLVGKWKTSGEDGA